MDRHRANAGLRVCFALCLSLCAGSLSAQSVQTCDIATQVGKVALPEDLNIRHFANGAVTYAIVDDGRDDVATALSVIVISPPFNAQGERQCRQVRATADDGYAAMLLDQALAEYDPAIGLTVAIPSIYLASPETTGDSVIVSVTVNQATGSVIAASH